MRSSVTHNREVRDASRALVYAFAAVYAAICLLTLPAGPFTAPDSTAYLEMQPIVPLGYPAFLRLFGTSAAIVVQPLLFAIALAWLGIEVLSVSNRGVVALGVMLGVVATPELRGYHVSILTESLFASGLVAFLAAAIACVRQPTWKRAVVAALIAGLSVTIRRAAYAFLPVLVFMVLLQRRRIAGRLPLMFTAAALPMLGVLAAESTAARLVHGEDATSLTGRHLFAKAALIDVPERPMTSSDRHAAMLHAALQSEFAPIRQFLSRTPNELKNALLVYYETCLQGPCVESLRASLGSISEGDKNTALARAAIARITASPLGFLRLTAAHYVSLWTAYKLRHPSTASAMTTFLAANRPLPFERETFKVTPEQAISFESSEVVRIVQPLVLAVGVLTGAVAMCGLAGAVHGRLSLPGSAAALAALTAHGCLMFSALAAAGLSRFMVSAFPAVVTALGLGLWWAGQAAQSRGGRMPRYH
jgi:hypothetical protein